MSENPLSLQDETHQKGTLGSTPAKEKELRVSDNNFNISMGVQNVEIDN
ncbi:4465_t:CDS:1, partial [Diversispora eburnea]